MSIVCATHFTASSADALQAAAAMARRSSRVLLLVTVVPAEPTGDVADAHLRATAPGRLEGLAAGLRGDGLDVRTRVLRGGLGHEVATVCREPGVELLVVGDSQRQGKALFGAPVDELASEVEVPLLVVRSLRPFTAWHDAPLRVLAALETGVAPGAAVEHLARLAEFGALEVLAAHVWATAQSAELGGDLAHGVWASADQLLSGLPPNVRHLGLERGAPAVSEAVVRLALREQVDLIVLPTAPHRGLPALLSSTSHEVLVGSATSILFVPQTPAVLLAAINPQFEKVVMS